ncbi:MAG TPA: hypothetical protein VEV19_05945 [Ktedonobacteraceae bacterium]|nr:hypothetical protein [Ktedonobacteraceae bacterium]
MSQQHMEYDDTNRQSQYENYDAGYRDPFQGQAYSAQKVYTQAPVGGDRARAGMRLALAIVSLALLVPLAGIILGIASGFGFLGPIYGLIGLGVVCVTVMVVNIAFNRH